MDSGDNNKEQPLQSIGDMMNFSVDSLDNVDDKVRPLDDNEREEKKIEAEEAEHSVKDIDTSPDLVSKSFGPALVSESSVESSQVVNVMTPNQTTSQPVVIDSGDSPTNRSPTKDFDSDSDKEIGEQVKEITKQVDNLVEERRDSDFGVEVLDEKTAYQEEKGDEEDLTLENNNSKRQSVQTDDIQQHLAESNQATNKQQDAQISFQTAIGNSLIGDHQEDEEEEEEDDDDEDEQIRNRKSVETIATELVNMEFTKNYSDDLLICQNEAAQQQAEMSSGGVDLADFELPPYSGSSSGSEPRQHSPIKRKTSSSSSSTAQPASSTQQTSVGLRGIRDLLMTHYSKVSHVLQWKKPIESGIYFSIGVTLIIALTFFSIISVVAYSALGIITTSGLMRVYKSLMQTLNKSTETPFDHVWDKVLTMKVSISSEKLHEFIDVSLGNFNSTLVYIKQVLLVEDKIATLKFGAYLYLLTYIGAWFNGMTIITICYLALFSLPIVYEKNKTEINQYFNLVQSHVLATSNRLTSMVFGSPKTQSSSGSGTASKKQN